ncbi:MAG: alpha-glucosidase/alpha-galactosidase [Chloroflexi bacterium]|nr:alpha-glucosidase/alpha-galactosidase [Chloroflexota bacterium]
MPTTKIVIIGAGSVTFGPRMIADAVLSPALRGSTLVLVDLDAERLQTMAAYAQRLNEAAGAGLRIKHVLDRKQALEGAEFVIVSVAIKRNELWKQDFQIPLRYGIKQVLGENGGPGGLSHALRNIPMILEIARDVEELCPNALLLNFSNPESRVTLALSRYSRVRAVGLCHGIGMGYRSVGQITGLPADDLFGIAAGLNHFSWFLDIRRRSTSEDVYPLLREADASYDPTYYPLTRRLLRWYGLYPHPSDDHIGEYLPFAGDLCGLHGYDFDRADRHRGSAWERIQRVVSGEEEAPLPPGATAGGDDRPRLRPSGEYAIPIIAATLANRHDLIEAVNIRNDGLIANLPDWAIVEVPAVVGRDGVRGLKIGALPAGIAALLNTQIGVQDLVVEAAVHGSRELALQALLMDPVVNSARKAEALLDDILTSHAEYLPQFAS